MSLKLVGLAYYADTATWKNDLDQEWSLEKIIKEELAQPALAPGGAGLDCLLGLSYALYRHEKRNLPIEGQFARAKKYIGEFQNYAFGITEFRRQLGILFKRKRRQSRRRRGIAVFRLRARMAGPFNARRPAGRSGHGGGNDLFDQCTRTVSDISIICPCFPPRKSPARCAPCTPWRFTTSGSLNPPIPNSPPRKKSPPQPRPSMNPAPGNRDRIHHRLPHGMLDKNYLTVYSHLAG